MVAISRGFRPRTNTLAMSDDKAGYGAPTKGRVRTSTVRNTEPTIGRLGGAKQGALSGGGGGEAKALAGAKGGRAHAGHPRGLINKAGR